MTTHAKTNRRKQRQEELREKLKGLEYIRQLDDIDKMLEAEPEMPQNKLNTLRVRIDLNFRRLNKILPDEKYVEVEGTFEGEVGVVRRVVVNGVKPEGSGNS